MNRYLGGKYDIIVVGGGHAGVEASLAAARLGMKTLLLSLSLDHIALMPCNPSVGGPAKGHVVREIDALGGQMGINADATQIQMRLLNTSKGPAVQALRAQSDKHEYRVRMAWTVQNQENLDVKQAAVEDLLIEGDHVAGVVCNNETMFLGRAVILTTGTYLRSRVIIGKLLTPAGPNNQPTAAKLSESLKDLGLELFRFKTGTPARVDRRSVDFSKTKEQPGSDAPLAFSYMTKRFDRPKVPCYSTYTNPRTHEIIRENLHLAPKYSGVIEGVGARYCPSIEDKVVRFADRDAHLLFLEPEGLYTNEIYVQGMSTGMPYEIQEKFMRTIAGLEHVKIMRPAYAIEYDGVVPTQLKPTLEYKAIGGLYGAGQINGTSGYEEAACQGLMAGINAALKLKEKEPLLLKRSDGYIGVLIDDLVNKGTNEPYRLFTSRAEYRLLLRNDNADLRLTEIGREIGLVDDERWRVFNERVEAIASVTEWLGQVKFSGRDAKVAAYLEEKGSAPVDGGISGTDLLKRPNIDIRDLAALDGKAGRWRDNDLKEREIEVKYEGYLRKQREQVARFEKTEGRRIPDDIDYGDVSGLRLEAAEKMAEIRPYTVGQASRISGVSPADISVLLVYLTERRGKDGEK
ncbi:MAG: tRNA uridine-5-carboxymethylaminomethyl(34) synthesis enzyme MnmG [Bacillota bacterium]|jgi:tRNA uridine 5-carboxymethylaminomethyl modification enzyme